MPACSERFVISMPGWEYAVICSPMAIASSSTGSATRDTSPIRAASAASTSRPVNIRSAAWLDPTARGNR
jgi:hypothetical protein